MLRSTAGLVLLIAIVRGLLAFDVEIDRQIEDMELAQILTAEHQRMSRELHDGAIQTVYTAGLIAESVRKRMEDGDPWRRVLTRVVSYYSRRCATTPVHYRARAGCSRGRSGLGTAQAGGGSLLTVPGRGDRRRRA